MQNYAGPDPPSPSNILIEEVEGDEDGNSNDVFDADASAEDTDTSVEDPEASVFDADASVFDADASSSGGQPRMVHFKVFTFGAKFH